MKPRNLQGIKHTNIQLAQEEWPAPNVLAKSLFLNPFFLKEKVSNSVKFRVYTRRIICFIYPVSTGDVGAQPKIKVLGHQTG